MSAWPVAAAFLEEPSGVNVTFGSVAPTARGGDGGGENRNLWSGEDMVGTS